MPNGWRDSVPIERKIDKRLLDRAIGELAGQQHGVVARTQLVAIGLGPSSIEMRLARRRLHRVHQGVYAVGHSCLSEKGRWMAAVLAGGPRAVLSHAPAGALWGIRPQGDLEVVVTGPRRVEPRRWMRFHRSSLPDDEITIKDGIPVTTAPRTLFDLAAVVSHGQLARAINEAEIRRLWDPLSLPNLLKRHPRRPGAAAIRSLIATPGLRVTRSELEDRFLAFLARLGLPLPATNVSMRVGGCWIEADCVWHEERLIAELDGHTTHRTRAAFETDRTRDRTLTAAGWRVIRITWRQLHDDPEGLGRDLRVFLAA
jgi:hypothetical protein